MRQNRRTPKRTANHRPPPRQGARRRSTPARGWNTPKWNWRPPDSGYIYVHAQTALSTLGRLYRAGLPSLLTIMVIGISLALPATLHIIIKNVRGIDQQLDEVTQISLFLDTRTTSEAASGLASRLESRPDVSRTRLITPEQALEEFRRLSGFEDALLALGENPLPAVIVIHPKPADAPTAEKLLAELRDLPEVERAQIDLEWLQRLQALVSIARRATLIIALLLGLAVAFVVGNTIRLDIENRRHEIELLKLIGATNAFVRRPFLYTGTWYGLLGATLACLLMGLGSLAMIRPVNEFATLYGQMRPSVGLSGSDILLIFTTGIALGLVGAWLAVGRHIRQVEPV